MWVGFTVILLLSQGEDLLGDVDSESLPAKDKEQDDAAVSHKKKSRWFVLVFVL